MVTLLPHPPARREQGFTLIEILVTILLMALGLLGLAGLQTRMLLSEFETYQRSQALLLLNDMANRITTNRASAAAYVTTASSPVGAGMSCPSSYGNLAQHDLVDWCNALQGAGETRSSASNRLGAMVGGRGCVEQVGEDYLVTVVWQGLTPVTAPPASVACGAGSYNATASTCSADRCRRSVTTLVRVARLS